MPNTFIEMVSIFLLATLSLNFIYHFFHNEALLPLSSLFLSSLPATEDPLSECLCDLLIIKKWAIIITAIKLKMTRVGAPDAFPLVPRMRIRTSGMAQQSTIAHIIHGLCLFSP